MSKRQYDLLFLSIFLVGLGVSLALVALGMIGLLEVFPVVLVIMGLYTVVLASSQKGEKGSFGNLAWGAILLVGGFMGILFIRNIFSGFLIPVILIVIGLIGAIAALRTRKETE